jgi:predicted N-acetyltransferase YhbS
VPLSALELRAARVEECAALTALAHAAKRHWRYPEEWMRLWAADLTVTPELLRDAVVRVAARGGEVVGFYALDGSTATFELEHFWVRPADMGRGVGRALFEDASRTARAAGACAIQIASDPNAEGFYLRLGARRVGEVASAPHGRRLPLLRIVLRGSGSP